MSESSFSHASEIAWEAYYRAVEGRSPRRLFLDAIAFLPMDQPRVAIDLGSGDGAETLALLARGWTVIAIDGAPAAIDRLRASVASEDAARLTTRVSSFHELVDLPEADFVYAGLSLPFCAPDDFADLWPWVTNALQPGGVFAGHFFGPNDSWADTSDMTFHTRGEVESLFASFDVQLFEEQDEDGCAVSGPKHWHVFHVIARKRHT